jgi:hypothetical protein
LEILDRDEQRTHRRDLRISEVTSSLELLDDKIHLKISFTIREDQEIRPEVRPETLTREGEDHQIPTIQEDHREMEAHSEEDGHQEDQEEAPQGHLEVHRVHQEVQEEDHQEDTTEVQEEVHHREAHQEAHQADHQEVHKGTGDHLTTPTTPRTTIPEIDQFSREPWAKALSEITRTEIQTEIRTTVLVEDGSREAALETPRCQLIRHPSSMGQAVTRRLSIVFTLTSGTSRHLRKTSSLIF